MDIPWYINLLYKKVAHDPVTWKYPDSGIFLSTCTARYVCTFPSCACRAEVLSWFFLKVLQTSQSKWLTSSAANIGIEKITWSRKQRTINLEKIYLRSMGSCRTVPLPRLVPRHRGSRTPDRLQCRHSLCSSNCAIGLLCVRWSHRALNTQTRRAIPPR